MTDRCNHLTVDEAGHAPLVHPGVVQITRRCLLCGFSYDRSEVLLRLRLGIRERHRLPSSPWSAAERAADPW